MSDINQEVQEAFGGVIGGADIYNPGRTVGYGQYPKPTTPGSIHLGLKQAELEKQLATPVSPWQKEITNRILHHENLIVNVSPSGGKTSPVLAAWAQLVRDWDAAGSTPSQKPTLLFVAKTKQLALQVYMDLHGELEKLLISGDLLGGMTSGTLTPNAINRIKTLLQSLIVIQTGGGSKTPFGPTKPSSETLAYVATPPLASKIASGKTKFRLVVIDELQEYLNKPAVSSGAEEPSSASDVRDMITIIRQTSSRDSSIVLMTGSLNEKSTESLKRWLTLITINNSLKRFRVIKKAVQNRSYIKVKSVGDLRSGNDLANLTGKIINNKQNNSLLMLFSVGEPGQQISPKTRMKIIDISEKLMRSLPRKSPEAIVGKSINRRTLTQSGRDTAYKSTIGGALQDFRKSDSEELQDMLRGYSVINGKRFPRDQILGECILHGFGYIAGGKKRIKAMGHEIENMDTIFVQKLFKEGKIQLMIATDAVGVGANLKVSHMYIPFLKKYSGGGFGPINASSLMQLVHRAGRDPREGAVIYCDSEDIGRISEAINASEPYIAIPEISTKNIKTKTLISLFRF